MPTEPTPMAVLVSGSGTNLQAFIDAVREDDTFGACITVVVSDRPGAYALQRAKAAGIATEIVDWAEFDDRDAFTRAVCDVVASHGAELLVLAGFMRILSPVAIERFRNRIVNTHPALLPAFPGGHAVEDALEYGVKVAGVTVHFVDEEVDNGPIIAQESVEVLPGDTAATLQERIQEIEHELYPAVVKRLVAGAYEVRGRRVMEV